MYVAFCSGTGQKTIVQTFPERLHEVLSLDDHLWYLTSTGWPRPNMNMLRNALRQTGWSEEDPEVMDLRLLHVEKFRSVDWPAIRRDIAPSKRA